MSVPESVSDPVGYWDSNVGGTTNLLHAMASAGCRRIVFSSTCAVYGEPERVPIGEDTPFAPLSPYGETKAAVERALAAAREADVLDAISLRYFNAAGAASDGLLGEAHDPETHLIPIALDAAQQGRQMTLFGEDHPTRDGTCVRDYIHVEDLAEAHLIATERLLGGDRGGAWNLGSGDGASVKEVLDTVGVVTGKPVPYVIGPRRAGDAPALVSDTRRSREELGWQTRHGLRTILEHAWAWHRNPRFGVR
jgi:UDP-glucose-4-epimerase GalE